ncbi:hypothetical protein RCH20_000546 [Psychrobacter sp. PL15]|nr:hypothetical protein [Psychrobacter sp. PL15]
MDTHFYKPSCGKLLLTLTMLLTISSSLLSCAQQPQSMFEQQANAESAYDIELNNNLGSANTVGASGAAVSSAIQASKQQAIARQPNCNPRQTRCQYFELNVLEFSPEQPWLNSIMWQTIARKLAPETPLASQDEVAKKTVSMLFNQIEYGEQTVKSLPMYQRIDTELVLNLPSETIPLNARASDNERFSNQVSSIASNNQLNAESELGYLTTGYLKISLQQHRNGSQQQFTYVMFDLQKELQLAIGDILLPEVSVDELVLVFQNARKKGLSLQGIEQKYHEDWPLQLSQQWYLDPQGLHMVYQSGAPLTTKTEAIDLLVPYTLLQGLVKPRYMVPPSIDNKA